VSPAPPPPPNQGEHHAKHRSSGEQLTRFFSFFWFCFFYALSGAVAVTPGGQEWGRTEVERGRVAQAMGGSSTQEEGGGGGGAPGVFDLLDGEGETLATLN
jgi:hypothetical protein